MNITQNSDRRNGILHISRLSRWKMLGEYRWINTYHEKNMAYKILRWNSFRSKYCLDFVQKLISSGVKRFFNETAMPIIGATALYVFDKLQALYQISLWKTPIIHPLIYASSKKKKTVICNIA